MQAEVPPAMIEKIGAPYQKATIPANTYTGQTTAVSAAAVQNYLVTRSNLSDDEVYQMTKTLFDNLGDVQAAHSAAKDISLEKAPLSPPVPLHPGAIRYYKEKNLKF